MFVLFRIKRAFGLFVFLILTYLLFFVLNKELVIKLGKEDVLLKSKKVIRNFGESSKITYDIIKSSKDALDVFDFEAVAKEKLSIAHYGYLRTGVEDNATLRANHDEIKKIKIRVRRLMDVSKINMTTKLFGKKWETPIVLAPVSSLRAFHSDGEIGTARAAKNKNHLMILSNYASTSIEEVADARRAPVWFQLYPADKWDVTMAMLIRAEAAKSPVVVVTVNSQKGSNRETIKRSKQIDDSLCFQCHHEALICKTGKPIRDEFDYEGIAPKFTWDYIRKLKNATSMKVVLKGIVTLEDARLSVENGVDGVIVSNHGGREEESRRATIDCLPEVVEGVDEKIPVLIDGGFRRGTDIFKALAMGATAVCIGRPYAWGLAAFGQEGVESTLDILRAELTNIMKQAGTPSINKINKNFIRS